MINDLQDVTRKAAETIANIICTLYPNSFLDKVQGKVFGSGIETLRAQIYNSVNYRKNRKNTNLKRIQEQDDSDEEEEKQRVKDRKKAVDEDEYGCVAYAPRLSESETSETQEQKRLSLLEMFNATDNRDSEKISEFMQQTYATQRRLLNADDRDITSIFTNWSFLKDTKYLIKHALILLGKDVLKTWNDSITEKSKVIWKFFFAKENISGKEADMMKIRCQAKEACLSNNNKVPKTLAIFPMLLLNFNENVDKLFKIVNDDTSENDSIENRTVVS